MTEVWQGRGRQSQIWGVIPDNDARWGGNMAVNEHNVMNSKQGELWQHGAGTSETRLLKAKHLRKNSFSSKAPIIQILLKYCYYKLAVWNVQHVPCALLCCCWYVPAGCLMKEIKGKVVPVCFRSLEQRHWWPVIRRNYNISRGWQAVRWSAGARWSRVSNQGNLRACPLRFSAPVTTNNVETRAGDKGDKGGGKQEALVSLR